MLKKSTLVLQLIKKEKSTLVKNVYFAGEVLDVDAVTGGFNLQVAWSSAYAAAIHLNN